MNKLSKKEIKEIFGAFNFNIDNMDKMVGIDVYHSHEWDHGYDGHTGFCGSRRQFYNDYFIIQNFLREYIRINNLTTAIIAPFHLINYFNGITQSAYDIYYEINDYLREHKINKRYESGLRICINDNWEIIDAICEGGYRNISNICIMFEEDKTIFLPWHHMNLYVYSNQIKKTYIQMKKIIKNHPNLQIHCDEVL